MNYTISPATWSENEQALRLVRTRVFIEEQSVAPELEWDGEDAGASHWLALDNRGNAVGTVRMLRDGHIGRMAILRDCRAQGIGRALLDAVLAHARKNGLFEVYLYAQTQAVDFYAKAGFAVCGEEFMDADIPHRTMRLQLAERRLLGEHGGNFVPTSIADVALDIIRQTRQHLRILSYDLDPASFDTGDIENALSALARKSRFSEIRILVLDTSKLVHQGHRLLTLHHRLSSSIRIRRPRNDPHDISDNLILADRCGIVCQSIREPETVWANFNNRPIAQNYISQFDDLWERAIEDPELRQLRM